MLQRYDRYVHYFLHSNTDQRKSHLLRKTAQTFLGELLSSSDHTVVVFKFFDLRVANCYGVESVGMTHTDVLISKYKISPL